MKLRSGALVGPPPKRSQKARNLLFFGLAPDERRLVLARLERNDAVVFMRALGAKKWGKLDRDFAIWCARRGYAGLLAWMHSLGKKYANSVTVRHSSILYLQVDVWEWLWEVGHDFDTTGEYAHVGADSTSFVRWLYRKGASFSTDWLTRALWLEYVYVAKLHLDNGVNLDHLSVDEWNVLIQAHSNGIIWMCRNGYTPKTTNATQAAFLDRNEPLLTALVRGGCPFSPEISPDCLPLLKKE